MSRTILLLFATVMLVGCSSSTDRALVLAASEGNLAQVQSLLQSGADVNYGLPDNGTTALMAAAENGHLPVVKTLLETGANINAMDHGLGTALYSAAFGGHIDVMNYLSSRGARLNCSNEAAKYLLKIVRKRKFREVEALLKTQMQLEGIQFATE